jgi:hypothetical protein
MLPILNIVAWDLRNEYGPDFIVVRVHNDEVIDLFRLGRDEWTNVLAGSTSADLLK